MEDALGLTVERQHLVHQEVAGSWFLLQTVILISEIISSPKTKLRKLKGLVVLLLF